MASSEWLSCPLATRYSLLAIRHSPSYEVLMPAHTMSHFTVLTRDVAATEAFYGELLGLKTGYRPPTSRPGVGLYAEDHPILHVIDPVNMPKEPAGVLDHMAFNATGLKEVAGKLKQRGIDYA